MTELRIDDVNARVVQFAETINNYAPPPVSAVALDAYRLLDKRFYRDAVASFSDLLRHSPDDQDLHFGIAVACLGGVRPHRHGRETIGRVVSHLRAAPELPHAVLLELLVAEDAGLYWQRVRSKAIPPHVATLAARISGEQARRILRHVPAPEARTWRALDMADRRKGAARR